MAINQACREQLLRNAICCVCPKGEMNKYESPQKQQKVSVIQCNLTKIFFCSKTPMEAGLNSKLSLIRRKKDNYLISLCTANRMRWWFHSLQTPTDLSWPLAFLLYYLTTFSYTVYKFNIFTTKKINYVLVWISQFSLSPPLFCISR